MNCPVCDSSENIVFNYNCAHCICNNCFVEWNSLNHSCPVCRSDLLLEEYTTINEVMEISNNQNDVIINDFYYNFVEFNDILRNEILNNLVEFKKILKKNYNYFFDNRELVNNYFLNCNNYITDITNDIFNQTNSIINNIFELLINIGLNNSRENFVLLNYFIFSAFNYIMDNMIIDGDLINIDLINEKTEIDELINDFNFSLHQNA